MIENSSLGVKTMQHTALRAAENVDRNAASQYIPKDNVAKEQHHVSSKELHDMMDRHLNQLHKAEGQEENIVQDSQNKLIDIRLSIHATVAALNALQGNDGNSIISSTDARY